MLEFRKVLVRKEIQIPIEIIIGTFCKEQSMGVKVNLNVKFVDEDLQMLSPFLLHSVKFGLLDSVSCQDQIVKTVEEQFWAPLEANFMADKKAKIPIHFFFREEVENRTEEDVKEELTQIEELPLELQFKKEYLELLMKELEFEKEFLDPETEEEAAAGGEPKKEESKQAENDDLGEEEKPPKELQCVSLDFDLKLTPGRK